MKNCINKLENKIIKRLSSDNIALYSVPNVLRSRYPSTTGDSRLPVIGQK
jgi:hypothetical protein